MVIMVHHQFLRSLTSSNFELSANECLMSPLLAFPYCSTFTFDQTGDDHDHDHLAGHDHPNGHDDHFNMPTPELSTRFR